MYPSVITTFTFPTPTDRLNSPSHSALHNTTSSAVGQIQTFVGTSSSAVGTLMYDIRAAASNGGGHVQTAIKGGTGQITYTKGDVLVASSSSVLTKLAVGTDGLLLTADSTAPTGVKWGVGGTPTIRTYTPSAVAIWNKPSNLSYIIVELQANGGGGAPTVAQTGGGGGGGAYVRRVVSAAALPTAASVLVRSGAQSSLVSYFGSIVQAKGGSEGIADGAGGAGGSVLLAGSVNINGQAGQGDSNARMGGTGGNAFLGKGGTGGPYLTDGTAATNGQDGFLGGGGGGGTTADGSPDGGGGAGGDGIVIVYEY